MYKKSKNNIERKKKIKLLKPRKNIIAKFAKIRKYKKVNITFFSIVTIVLKGF